MKLLETRSDLVFNFCYNASANGSAAFANRESLTFFHRNRGNQLNIHQNVVTRHHHFRTLRQLTATRHIRRLKKELRLVTLEKWRMTAAFVFRQNVNLALKLRMRRDRPGLVST